MSDQKYPFTKEEFDAIYSKVPRLTVEIIVKNTQGAIYMTKRAIEPCIGDWCLPGGTVYFGESLLETVQRVALRELGIEVLEAHSNGYIEYPSHYLHGLDAPVGIVFEIVGYSGEITVNEEASEGAWFTKLPDKTHADQATYLLQNHYLIR